MRRLLGLCILTLAFPLAVNAAAAPEKTPDYYPLKVGTAWHYKFTAGEATGEATNRVAKIEKIDGKDLARVETEAGGKVVASEHITSTDKGVFRNRFNGLECSPPLCLLKLPIKEDESWEAEITIGKEKSKVVCKTLGREEVTVPSGKYKTVKTQIELNDKGKKVISVYWFAPDVGVVKQSVDVGPMNIAIELQKVELGK